MSTQPNDSEPSAKSRRTWPIGLRVVFWVMVVGTLIATYQLAWLTFFSHEPSPDKAVYGVYSVTIGTLDLACICLGFLARRRAFALTALAACLIDVVTACYFNVEFVSEMWQAGFSGIVSILSWPDSETWGYHWNGMCLITNVAILCYLLRYEIRRHKSA